MSAMQVEGLQINSELMDCVIKSTQEGISMTGIQPDAVGASKFSTASKELSVLVGLHGARNGNMTMNLSERTATFLAGKLFADDSMVELNEDAIDGVCEIGNMVAGRMKEILCDTEFAFDAISLPAIIFGANYNLYHLKNIVTVSVTFEINEVSIVNMKDKFFSTSVALMGT